MSYSSIYDIASAADHVLRKQLAGALQAIAAEILHEDDATTGHTERLAWAEQVLLTAGGPISAASKWIWLVLTDAGIVADPANATDAAVKAAAEAFLPGMLEVPAFDTQGEFANLFEVGSNPTHVFRKQLAGALHAISAAILVEDEATDNHANRSSWAERVLADPARAASLWVWPMLTVAAFAADPANCDDAAVKASAESFLPTLMNKSF